MPTTEELEQACEQLTGDERIEFSRLYLGAKAQKVLEMQIQKLNQRFERYMYYCVSAKPDSNLMWSHYASSHTGFCIEWDAGKLTAEKVEYQENITRIRLFELISQAYGLSDGIPIAKLIKKAFHTKLLEWEYEAEYRFMFGIDSMESLVVKREKDFALVLYQPEWIKSIIWGCKTSDRAKTFIKENMPFSVKFKQAVAGMSSIYIQDEEVI